MRIIVLDGYTLNPGDLSWKDLEALGQCTIYDRTAPQETIQRADGAEIVLTNKTVLSAEVIERLKALKYISVLATGYNVVDVEAARKQGILVSNVPTYATESVAQMVFAHILNLAQNVAHHARTVRDGRWCTSPDFCYWDMPLIELQGLTMGIIGFGRIGQATARLALAFGMKVIVNDIVAPPQVLPRSPGHFVEWIEACKGGKPAGSNFDHAGPLAEAVLLGNVTLRPQLRETLTRTELLWDGPGMKITNVPEANDFLHREYREGWTL